MCLFIEVARRDDSERNSWSIGLRPRKPSSVPCQKRILQLLPDSQDATGHARDGIEAADHVWETGELLA